SQSRKPVDWQVELALPFLLGLPDNAIRSRITGAVRSWRNLLRSERTKHKCSYAFPEARFHSLQRAWRRGGPVIQTRSYGVHRRNRGITERSHPRSPKAGPDLSSSHRQLRILRCGPQFRWCPVLAEPCEVERDLARGSAYSGRIPSRWLGRVEGH